MKKIIIAAIAPIVMLGASSAFANTQDCATRANAIQAQIQAAQQYGNTNRVAALQNALAQVKANCTNAGQSDRANNRVQDKQRNVRKAQDEVRQAESKLREAQARGDARRIQQAQSKLAEKQDKLREKMDDLSNAQGDAAALRG
ncbi:DUF1090 family protein [Paraburkholderia bonniea]|uniref:DUF1090 family protein n=1 Tax=Paraburkholderia bonniea TaxID=2152891 RepID=UPI001580E044|nr:DUF1090 family protein [Paraburkholderia bonniea]WJF89842.1 DUF1090 family protein [Paraburkholderia bonniea]WJF93156.1 DUF1090 family protein [Paraburkholderia bonniea]